MRVKAEVAVFRSWQCSVSAARLVDQASRSLLERSGPQCSSARAVANDVTGPALAMAESTMVTAIRLRLDAVNPAQRLEMLIEP